MKQVKIITYLKTEDDVKPYEYEIDGIKKDNKLTFYEDDIKVEIVIYDDCVLMKRSNFSYTIDFKFKLNDKLKVKHIINDYNFQIDYDILTSQLNILDTSLDIIYILTNNNQRLGKFNYKIRWYE